MQQYGNKRNRRASRTKINSQVPCDNEPDERQRVKRWLESPVSILPVISKRVVNCLELAGIHTVGQLLETSTEQLMTLRNFGETSVEYCLEALRTCHLPTLKTTGAQGQLSSE